MPQKLAIGKQDFAKVREGNYFYIDKTPFIKAWWDTGDDVTLITRPRRFGKTLNMSMLEYFFSQKYKGREDLFKGLAIWEDETYRMLQGTYPVIALSFANIKGTEYANIRQKILQMISRLYTRYDYLVGSSKLNNAQKKKFCKIMEADGDLDDATAEDSLNILSEYLHIHHDQKVLIFLDEYDTPMQEAYLHDYWDEIVFFIRNLFNSSFKTNPSLERAILTGITRISKESIFSDLNNLEVITTTSEKFETYFGFTEKEVFNALEHNGCSDKKADVKQWYDGFTFGTTSDIYNPWSIINFIDKKKFSTYWVNTSANGLAGKLIREGLPDVKRNMEDLLEGKEICARIDEQIVFNQLDENTDAIWSLLLASGYLKVVSCNFLPEEGENEYHLALTNFEVRVMFRGMIRNWFKKSGNNYNDFIKALLTDNKNAMNNYMNRIALATFSFFDTGNHPSNYTEPERFYHGFVLGLMIELRDKYQIKSNRESGFGRYDVILEPREGHKELDAIVIEFKVIDSYCENSLEDTVKSALNQIEALQYDEDLISKGILKEKIRHYGFAFEGKKVFIG